MEFIPIQKGLENPKNKIGEEKKETSYSDNYSKILASRIKLRAQIKQKIKFSPPLLLRDEMGVVYPNTINVVQGKSGVHKSRLVENLCSALLTNKTNTDFLGFKVNPDKKCDVLYVDTERNQNDQFPAAIQKIIVNAGFSTDTDLPNFDFISLIEIGRAERFEALKEYLHLFKASANNHRVIVLDVITDCISNFNDPNETLKLIDLLNVMINKYNVTFICLIHENPSSGDKARGHLGTEIMNKASTVIQIGFEKDAKQKDCELIKVNYLKCRNSKKLDSFHLIYSEEAKGLVVAGNEMVGSHLENKNRENTQILREALSKSLIDPLEKSDLMKNLGKTFGCSTRTLEAKLKHLIDNKVVIKNPNGQNCYLKKETMNRKAIYKLESVVI